MLHTPNSETIHDVTEDFRKLLQALAQPGVIAHGCIKARMGSLDCRAGMIGDIASSPGTPHFGREGAYVLHDERPGQFLSFNDIVAALYISIAFICRRGGTAHLMYVRHGSGAHVANEEKLY